MYDIGARVGIEGESQFRAQISRINKDYKSMESYLQALDKAMDRNGKSMEALQARHNGLQQQLAMQEKKHKELTEALEKVRGKYDAGSQEVLRFEGALLDVDQTMEDLRRRIADTEGDMVKLANGIEDVADAADDADGKIMSFGDMLKAGLASGAILHTVEEIGERILDLGRDAATAAADVKASNSQFSATFRDLEGAARQALDGISEDIKMSSGRLQSAYTALYAFTKNVGGDSTQALNIADRAMRAAADSAAYYDRTVEDAAETLQSFLKGNYENDAALGIAATETTRNAKANELYAKSFKDLAEAQKVDVLLAMVEAGNAASGALGAAAREADEWTNVTGELAEAWRQLLALMGGPVLEGLTPVIQGVTEALKGLAAQTPAQELTAGMDAFRASLADADAQLQQSNASMAATAGLAQQYVERLHALETAGLTTAESQREYAQTVELLNTLMPQLGLTINAATGLLDQNTGAIQNNIASLKKQAQQQAQQAYYKKIIDQYAKAYEDQYAAQKRLIELQEQEQQLLEQGADATIEYSTAMVDATSAMPQMTRALSDLDLALLENQAEQRNLAAAIEASGVILAEHEQQLTTATQGYEGLTDAERQAAEAAAAQGQAQAELEAAYADSLKAARGSIDSQIGLFEKLATKSEMSREDIIANWQTQQKAFQNYAANLQKAVDMGLDDALIRQLSDGSEQSMLILAELVGGTEKDVDEINAAFQGLEESKDTASAAMVDVEKVLGGAFDRMEDSAETAGGDIASALARGLRNNRRIIDQALSQITGGGTGGSLSTWEPSGSARTVYSVPDAGTGVDQIQRQLQSMEDTMTQLSRSGTVSTQRQMAADAAAYPSVTAGAVGYTTNTVHNTKNVSLGGVTVVVNASPGQDPTELAYEVAGVLEKMFDSEVSAIG